MTNLKIFNQHVTKKNYTFDQIKIGDWFLDNRNMENPLMVSGRNHAWSVKQAKHIEYECFMSVTPLHEIKIYFNG